MTLDEILEGLFPSGHDVKTSPEGVIAGAGKRKSGQAIAVIGVANGAVEARLTSLARAVVVRDYLIQRGVSGAQIKVRALGNRAEGGGSLDRVDLMVLGS